MCVKNNPPDPDASYVCFYACLVYDCAGDNDIEVLDVVTCTDYCIGLAIACNVQ